MEVTVVGRGLGRLKITPSLRQVPPLLTVLCVVGAQAAEAVDHAMVHGPLFAVTRALTLCAYISLLCGVALLPARAVASVTRNRIVIDAFMITIAYATFGWYAAVGPVFIAGGGSVTSHIVTVQYVLLDHLLLFVGVLQSAQLHESVRRRTLPLLVFAIGVILAADIIVARGAPAGKAAHMSLDTVARNGGLVLAAFAVGTAISRSRASPADGVSQSLLPVTPSWAVPSVWRYMLPYMTIPATVALMIGVAAGHTNRNVAFGAYGLGAALIELVFVHQFLAYQELMASSNKSERYATLAAADPITGLGNHRTAVMTLDRELEEARGQNGTCCLLFLDLDHFKSINDRFGHRVGDAALHEFAAVVRSVLRTEDTLCRWGGEEFVAVLPRMDTNASLLVAERIRRVVDERSFRAVGGDSITCSIGVASYPQDAPDRDTLVERADRAMYAAKHSGRNRVCLPQLDTPS